MHPFSLLTSHFLVMVYVAKHPDARVTEIARCVDITQRRVASILRDLIEAGYLVCERNGRRNRYSVSGECRLTHPLVADVPIGLVLSSIANCRDGDCERASLEDRQDL
jgi:DNA-binding transcriptional ArsR family regulator